MTTTLTFKCPSCGAKLPQVEAQQIATQVVRRTCRRCKERWQLVVQPLVIKDGVRIDKATFAFMGCSLGHITPGRAKEIKE